MKIRTRNVIVAGVSRGLLLLKEKTNRLLEMSNRRLEFPGLTPIGHFLLLNDMPRTPDPLLTAVENFLREVGMSPSMFGKRAVQDPVLVTDLRNGREPRRETRERVIEFIERELEFHRELVK